MRLGRSCVSSARACVCLFDGRCVPELASFALRLCWLCSMDFFLKDTHYRNQFETGTSGGTLSVPTRVVRLIYLLILAFASAIGCSA